jgi:hypothetical protein
MDSRTGEENAILDQRVTDGVICHLKRNSPAKNRMREIRTSGSVGGEDGNILAYPATTALAV